MKKVLSSLAIVAALVLTGCSKKMNQFSSDYFTTIPTPLEVRSEKVPGVVTANIPPKFFVKDAEVTVTPVLVYGDQEATSMSYVFQGEKVRGNNQVVYYDNGGTASVPFSFDYVPEMAKSDLYLAFEVRQGNKTYVLPRVKVGEGCITTSTLASAATVPPAITADAFQRIINEKYSADIKFLINQTNIRASELKGAELASFNEVVKGVQDQDNKEVEGISISSYASPDGGVKLNTRIAEGREQSTVKYLNGQIKKNGLDKHGELTAEFTAQDWEGFKELVSQSDIQDKDLILSVLAMYSDPEQREKEIRNISAVFDQLAEEILPQLRYSRLTASINTIGKSDEELMAAFDKNEPLTVEELLYTATLTNDNNKKAAIYARCVKEYPNDYRGYNNLGLCQYIAGNYDAAAANFAKAAQLAPTCNETKMNQGLIALVNKDYNTANEKVGSAAGVEGLPEALGLYYIEMGDYNAAVKAFGNTKSNNAALAQILTGDYNAARNTLAAVAATKADATTYYLSAVLGARTNNEQMVKANLSKAFSIDSSLKNKAQNDLEFAQFDLSGIM